MQRLKVIQYLNVRLGSESEVILSAEGKGEVVHVSLTPDEAAALWTWIDGWLREQVAKERKDGE